jgi:hypothetical protein
MSSERPTLVMANLPNVKVSISRLLQACLHSNSIEFDGIKNIAPLQLNVKQLVSYLSWWQNLPSETEGET